jgi:hypothetical protein
LASRKKPVFINCPFDDEYRPLFNAIIFTILRCGYHPRCALEVIDGAATRISKIEKLIEDCQLGIHDISRTELDAVNNLPRFNMPLELGLFLGAKRFGDTSQRRKKCLVLDTAPYRFQMFMSDIAGQDIAAHNGDVDEVINRVRAFLNSAKRGNPLPSGNVIRESYDAFLAALPAICQPLGVNPDALEYQDFVWAAADYVSLPE